jgi:predicted ATPase
MQAWRAMGLRSLDVPFTCEACGGWSDLIPAVGVILRCPHCSHERPFVRPPLLVVTGTSGIGKSTLCARLAGTIPAAVLGDLANEWLDGERSNREALKFDIKVVRAKVDGL